MKIGTASTAESRDHLSFLIARAARGRRRRVLRALCADDRKMRKTARAVCARGAEVEDILQDAYLKIWRNAPNFDPDRSSPISWMSVIVRNTAIDALRLKTLPTTDLDLRFVVPEPVSDGADDFDYDRARPIAATVDPPTAGRPPSTAVARLHRRRKPPIAVEAFWCTRRHHQDLAAANAGDGAHRLRGIRGSSGELIGVSPLQLPLIKTDDFEIKHRRQTRPRRRTG